MAEHAQRGEELVQQLNGAREEAEDHGTEIAESERQFLLHKQQQIEQKEQQQWDLEEQQLQDRFEVAKRQVHDCFLLQKHQMSLQCEEELLQAKRTNDRREGDLEKSQAVERRQWQKHMRHEMEVREETFKESLRSGGGEIGQGNNDRIRSFHGNEVERCKVEKDKLQTKQQGQLEELQAASLAAEREPKQNQDEKRALLKQHEHQKTKELENNHHSDVRDLEEGIKCRKKILEDDFERQIRDHEQFHSSD